ncbi:hypothetical protein CLCR_02938 [Cladophialophora carrionii]|uniref:Uncharacterized protein n=1 Tax=Cladophialophora carrionii TaxID=86049 RepID=A0A1C1D2A0_9EURO|nr:hypothetical protein CLCR_02938 [Cladophialophora carrionii]
MTSPSTPSLGTPPPPPATARPLQGRIAIVTGSSSAIGAAIALALAAQGCSLFCIDVTPTPPRQSQGQGKDHGHGHSFHSTNHASTPTTSTTARDQPGTHERIRHQGGEATYHKADPTRARDMDLAIRACVAKYRRVDILVTNTSASASAANAATAANVSMHTRPLRCHETTDEDFDRALAVHARAPFLACKYAVRQMLDGQPRRYARARGWIVNVASSLLLPLPLLLHQGVGSMGAVSAGAGAGAGAGVLGIGMGMGIGVGVGSPGSCAGQAAAVMLTRQIALDYAADAILCNALCPGFVDAGTGTGSSTGTAGMATGSSMATPSTRTAPSGAMEPGTATATATATATVNVNVNANVNAHGHGHGRRSHQTVSGQPQSREDVADVGSDEAEDNDYDYDYDHDNDYADGSPHSESKLDHHPPPPPTSPPFGGRLGSVEDVARAAVFLCGDDAAWITGVVLPVDGGGSLLR